MFVRAAEFIDSVRDSGIEQGHGEWNADDAGGADEDIAGVAVEGRGDESGHGFGVLDARFAGSGVGVSGVNDDSASSVGGDSPARHDYWGAADFVGGEHSGSSSGAVGDEEGEVGISAGFDAAGGAGGGEAERERGSHVDEG